MSDLRLTVLVDNIENNGLNSEWGLSLYIEYNGKSYLLDGGQSEKFAENAQKLGIDIKNADAAILSHAHYDHANGLPFFFVVNKKAKLYLRDGAKENCFGKRGIFYKYIGIKRGMLKKYADRIVYAKGKFKLDEGVWLVPHEDTDFRKTAKLNGLFKLKKLWLKPDDFMHEQSVVFETEKGLCVFNSCCHAGADNILSEISRAFGDKKTVAIIGGFHLYKTDEKDVEQFARRLLKNGIDRVVTGHCTGDAAFKIIKDVLGEKAQQMYCGYKLEI